MTSIPALASVDRPGPRPRRGWPAVTGVLLLSVAPVIGGAMRLGETGANGMLDYSPVQRIAHVVGMTVFCLLGAFQFSPALRRGRSWHRLAGRVLVPAGFVAALSGVWFAIVFRGTPPAVGMAMVRGAFAVAMTVFLALGVKAIVRRDFGAHGAWLTRAYAIAVTGGTQALVFLLWALVTGKEVVSLGEPYLVAASFVINSAVAEVVIMRRARRARRRVTAALVS